MNNANFISSRVREKVQRKIHIQNDRLRDKRAVNTARMRDTRIRPIRGVVGGAGRGERVQAGLASKRQRAISSEFSGI